MTRKTRPRIDPQERREELLRPHRFLGYNRDELGMYFMDRGAENIAEAQFRRAIWLNPYEPEFKIHLAGCLFSQSRFQEAKQWALSAQDAAPDRQAIVHLLKSIDAKMAEPPVACNENLAKTDP